MHWIGTRPFRQSFTYTSSAALSSDAISETKAIHRKLLQVFERQKINFSFLFLENFTLVHISRHDEATRTLPHGDYCNQLGALDKAPKGDTTLKIRPHSVIHVF
jgi:hypothetical protein